MIPDIPEVLRRDKSNKAPFMDPPLRIHLDGSMSVGGQAIVGVTPATNPQETAPAWSPPWVAKS